MPGTTLYLVVRDADGAIMAEFDSPSRAIRALLDFDGSLADAGLSLMRFHDHQGEFVGTTSWVTARLANMARAGA